jgi:hypothetical protein
VRGREIGLWREGFGPPSSPRPSQARVTHASSSSSWIGLAFLDGEIVRARLGGRLARWSLLNKRFLSISFPQAEWAVRGGV